jgi:SAM-dependent methyltransferase
MLNVITNKPIAFDSPDHLDPVGSIRDNNSNIHFILEIKKYFNNKKINILDLGCSGGQIVIDHILHGDLGIGLEGSSSVFNGAGKHNWEHYYNKNLFLCDINEPFELNENGDKLNFDCIQMWEVLEHIPSIKFEQLFKNIKKHMKPDGIFIGSVAIVPDPPRHVSLFSKERWAEIFKEHGFQLENYYFNYLPRAIYQGNEGFGFTAKLI